MHTLQKSAIRPDQINLLLHGFAGPVFALFEKNLNAHEQYRPFTKYCRTSTLPHAAERQKLTGH